MSEREEPPLGTRAHCYLDLLSSIVIAKHAIGPERLADGTEVYPPVPVTWVQVPVEQYVKIPVGIKVEVVAPTGEVRIPPSTTPPPIPPGLRAERLDERLARIEARLARLEARSPGPPIPPTASTGDVVPTDGIDWS